MKKEVLDRVAKRLVSTPSAKQAGEARAQAEHATGVGGRASSKKLPDSSRRHRQPCLL